MRGKGTKTDKMICKGDKTMLYDSHHIHTQPISKGGTLALHEHDPKDQKHHLSS